MIKLVLDFESYYDSEFTLKKMTTEEYVRDDRFESLCLGIWVSDSYNFVLRGGSSIREWASRQNWNNMVVICHHAQFDCFILSHVYGVKPRGIICTMSMSRAVNGPLQKASLEALCAKYGLEQKTTPYNKFIGKHWKDMDRDLQNELCNGCLNDCRLTMQLYEILEKDFPKSEYGIVDMTVRMFTEPKFIGDVELFEKEAIEERKRKDRLLFNLDITEANLQSAATMVRLLERAGETVEMKSGKNGPIPALAASDSYMLELATRDDLPGEIARARLDVKSTIKETRAARLASMARRGPMPVYLGYFRAVTGRWGGGQATNLQNLPKPKKKGEITLRSGLMAPPGCQIVKVDFSQIEYRILCTLAGQADKLEALDEGRDIYCEFGTKLFGYEVDKTQKIERDFSKKIVLGAGYGQGKDKCAFTAKANGYNFPRGITDKAIDLYRHEHYKVVEFWEKLDKLLKAMETSHADCCIGPVMVYEQVLEMPNGTEHRFDLVWSNAELNMWRRTNKGNGERGIGSDSARTLLTKGYTRYWGGALTEFLCQALARVRLSDLMLSLKREHGINPCLLVHDEYVTIVPDDKADEAGDIVVEHACRPSVWWPDGPEFKAEGKINGRYGDELS
jgi:hypothetical protein